MGVNQDTEYQGKRTREKWSVKRFFQKSSISGLDGLFVGESVAISPRRVQAGVLMGMIISLCYTTVRPEYIQKVVDLWFSRASNPGEVEMIISTDMGDLDCDDALKKIVSPFEKNIRHISQPDPDGDCVKGWNVAAAASTGKILLAVADDFLPPLGWDEKILNTLKDYPNGIDGEYVVKVSDGYNPDLATLAIITRSRYNRFGYLFYLGYESLFSDTELTYRAIQDKVLIEAKHLFFEHIHPDAGKRGRDAADMKHASPTRWARGEDLFNFRQKRGFPTDRGPVAVGRQMSALNPNSYVAYLQVVKDDFCLREVMESLQKCGVSRFRIIVPTTYWSGTPTPQSDIDGIKAVAETFKNCEVKMALQNLSELRQAAKDRTDLETLARNQAIRMIANEGFDHILVVDSDELWRKDLFQQVMHLVYNWDSTSIRTGMVPVVGVPGCPVGDAQDRVTIYQQSDMVFQNCRTPYGIPHELGNYGVIHFTATRKNLKDVVSKMRDSGHYGDPDYDFEGFIANRLPNAHVGARNIHFYRHSQIWPHLRPWTKDEWADIPESIKPHLTEEVMT